MIIDDRFLKVTDFEHMWLLTLDLQELIRTTGVKGTYVGTDGKTYREIITKQPEARRILKYILPYLDDAALEWMDEHFQENAVLDKIWRRMRP